MRLHLQPWVRFTALCLMLTAVGGGAYRVLHASALDNSDHRAAPVATTFPSLNQANLQEAYGKLPLSFEVNLGQVDAQAQFVSRTRGGEVFLTNRGVVVVLNGGMSSSREYFRMEWLGSNSSIVPQGVGELPGRANFFIGNQPSAWLANIPTYQRG